MKPFLKYVAEDLIARGLDLSETAIIFPNKRASVFFDSHLYDSLQRPFWSPNYIAINELWSQFSSLQIADPILLNVTLHKIYNRFLQTDESFDEFYFWGELLLRDFDDLDKHLVDARQLFQNVQSIKAMENPLQYLTEEQIQVLNQFFVNFDPQKSSQLKERFIQIWSFLSDIYEQFGQVLKSQNLAYEGLLMRDVIESKLNKEIFDLPYKNYVFVGFNVLNTAEETLFKFFKNTQNALFYWDYDESFFKIPNHEAGIFIKRNLQNFENALSNPAVCNSFEASQKTKRITFVASPTENAQTRYADEWLKTFKTSETEAPENAIVLYNEQLLMPLISALSDENVANITMGYPVKQTPIFGKVRHFLISHTNTAKSPKDMLLELIEMLKFELKSDAAAIDQLYQEATFRVVLQLNRVVDLIQNHQLELTMSSLQRLIDQMLSVLTVPFLGEPVLGTQIMGVLETRNLDFKNLIMLSVNEGMLPKSANHGSFIPYTLRKAFGMTIPEHKTAVYAYYFFRLMQRAENVALVYNTATEGLNRGEMSRFMLQLMIENGFEIEHKTLATAAVELQQSRKINIPKTPEIRKTLLEKYNKEDGLGLSPSAINTFLTCKLKFYLRYVIGLEAKKPDIADMDAATIGTWFHRSAEILYRTISNQLNFDETNKFVEFSGSLINADDLRIYLDDEKREKLIDAAFVYEKHCRDARPCVSTEMKTIGTDVASDKFIPEYSGEELIVRRLLSDNLKRLILLDVQKAPFTLLAMEKKISEVLTIGDMSIKIGGYIDRMDNIDGYLRVVDYKTGGRLKMLKTDKLQDLFDEKKITENRNYLQALIYSFLISKTSKNCRILPCLLHVHEAHKSDYSPTFLPNDFNEISVEFENYLTDLLQEIFNPNTEFNATETPTNCRYCDYLELCRKKVYEF
ncbi:MAG: PD-(D/E)XK nuclease family protein [Bacteroidales bacterium]|jgi:CRISPR/Cas system-associated exonuclease Cas4 (RecB family)|nr:PD-(D/E)XK nuclease family protein [Bacteroidales bacterium]